MTLEKYISDLKDKKIAVIGLGVSNRPLVKLLLDAGCCVTVCDKRSREMLGEQGDALEAQGCHFRLGENYLDDLTEDVIFRTPGLHPFTRQLSEAAARGAVVTSEMEAFFRLCPCRIIAVTGSDGKTTTTTVISELLKAAGHTVWLGGNIGTPLLDKIPDMCSDHIAVLELSSFQLHSMNCHPNVAVITNISPNHLDVHPSYEDYQDAKKQIFRAQTAEDVLVLNADNTITASFAPESRGKVRLFSRSTQPETGVYLRDGIIYRARNGEAYPLMEAGDILIPGLHNVENYMAAFAATEGLVPDDCCRQVAKTFPGVEHRLEQIRVLRGVTYINDSIASSPTRTAAGLHALKKKPLLIAGGYDKHIPFDALGDEICRHVKALFLTGFTAEKIYDAVVKSPYYDPNALPIVRKEEFRDAVLAAANAAEEGDLVVLSPACASFDHFKNFAERGNSFRKIVMELE